MRLPDISTILTTKYPHYSLTELLNDLDKSPAERKNKRKLEILKAIRNDKM